MIFRVLVWAACCLSLLCGGAILKVGRLEADRVLDVEVPFNATPNDTNGGLVELMEEVLPLEVVEIRLNISVPGLMSMVEVTWGFNWTGASVLNSRQAETPVGIFFDHFQLQVEGIDALNVIVATNASLNETEPLLTVYCTNTTTTFNCYLLVDLEAFLQNGTADNETFMHVSVPFLANFEPWEEVEFLFSALSYNEDNTTESTTDVFMRLMAVRPVLEMTVGESPPPGCPSDAVYLDTLVQHDINTSAVDAFSISLLSSSGSFSLFTPMRPQQINLLEITENATIPVGIILPFIDAGKHEPSIFIQYTDDSRGNSYTTSDTTYVWIKSYPAWDYRVQSSFVETSADEVTVFEYFQLKAYVNTPDDNDTVVSMRACSKYLYSLSSGQLPVNILSVTLVQDSVEEVIAITDTLMNPSVGCFQGGPPVPPQNCTCWDVAPFTVPQMHSHTPFLLFTFQVHGNATQGEGVTFTMSLSDNLTNESCMVPSFAEQEVQVVEPAIVTVKSIMLIDIGSKEPPMVQVNISVHHAASSRSAAINVTVTDELPEGFSLVDKEVSDPSRVQVTVAARRITFYLNETLLLGESVTLAYWGSLDAQYFIAHSGVEQFLTITTDYTGVEHNAPALFSMWSFDCSAKIYTHTQDDHCISITAYPHPRFSRLAVGWAATSGGAAGLAVFAICGLVYLRKKRLACCGQYVGVAPEGMDEEEIVGYTELEGNSHVWQMEHRQDPEGENTETAPSPLLPDTKEQGSEFFGLGEGLPYTELLLQAEGASYTVDRFAGLLARELATIDREHARLMLTSYVAIATNSLSELQLPAGEKKEVVKRFSRQCALIVDSHTEQGHDRREQLMQVAMEAITSEVAFLQHSSEERLLKVTTALEGEGAELHKLSMDGWNRVEESRVTALKEAQLTAAQREQCVKEKAAIFEAIQAVKRLYLSVLKETDGLDSAQKGEAAIRTIEWTTLVGKRLNQMRAKLQVDAVEHFARVTKFQAEVDHLIHLSAAQIEHLQKHIKKAARALVKNGIVDKEDASGMVEKVTEKWPQPEDRALLIQQQMQAAEKRKVGTARGREKEVPIEELARAKTSDALVEKAMFNWRVLRNETMRKEEDEVELKVMEQLKKARLEVYREIKALLLDRKVSFSTKLLLRGVHVNQTRKLEDMYQSGEKEVLQEAEERRSKREGELSQRLTHIKQQVEREQEYLRATLDCQKEEWTEEVNKTYHLRPRTAHSSVSGQNSPLPEEHQQAQSGISIASSLMGELEAVWKEWKEILRQRSLWFEGAVLNAFQQQDGAEKRKELSKAFLGLKDCQVKDEVQECRRAVERETASSLQNELEMVKCKLEGNVTRVAMENARQVVQLQEQQRSHEKLQYELLAEMLNKHKLPQEEVEGVIQQYNDDCQTLMHKLEGEKHRQMEAVKAKIEERRLRKERAASKSPASRSTTFSLEKEPRLKQLIIKYRWEIKMESIRKEYQERLKRVTESTTRSHELKLLEAMNALDRRLTENFAKLGHIPMSNFKVKMEQRRASMPLSGQGGGGSLPPLKEEGYPGAGLGAGPSRGSAPWQLNPGALPGKNNKLPPLHITLSKPQQHP